MGTQIPFSPNAWLTRVAQLVYVIALSHLFVDLVHSSSAAAFISGSVIKCYNEGESVKVSFLYNDPCIKCKCQNQEIVCERDPCSQLSKCSLNGKVYKSGDSWKNGTCNKCSCSNGEVRCQVEVCQPDLICSKSQRMVRNPGDCCPACIENDGQCTLKGDPFMVRTFDGNPYKFEGKCNYVLSRDCEGKAFSIHLVNETPEPGSESPQNVTNLTSGRSIFWAVVVKVDQTKVRVSKGPDDVWKIRVGRKSETFPFLKLGVLTVVKDSNNVLIRTNLGIKVVWSGESFLEINLPSNYKSKVCGLCGNYNGDIDDDLLTKRGRVVDTMDRFFTSWKVGKSASCANVVRLQKKRIQVNPDSKAKCTTNWEKRLEAMNVCNVLKASAFSGCHRTVSIVPYYKSCLADMCDCSTKQCHCKAVQAYVLQCQRLGFKTNSASCDGFQPENGAVTLATNCPPGAIFTPCASLCRKTCRNFRRNRVCRKPCKPGCDCPPGSVWHNNRCIQSKTCPLPITASSSVPYRGYRRASGPK